MRKTSGLLGTSLRGHRVWIWGGVSALCLVAGGLFWFPKTHNVAAATEAPAPNGSVQLTADQYSTLGVSPVTLRSFHDGENADGKITTNNDLTVSVLSPFTGFVDKVFVEPGDAVVKGQALFSVNANEYEQARADLATARANLSVAKAQEQLAKTAETRAQALYNSAGGALKDYEQAQHDLVAAQGATVSAEAALKSEIGKLKILGLSASDLSSVEGTKDRSVIVRAPISGRVSQRALSPGMMIASQGTLAIVLTDTSSVWLEAEVSESDANKVRVGQTVSVHVSAYPDHPYTAKILSVSPVLDPDTHRLPVRAEIRNTDGALKPEMFASFDIAGDVLPSSLAVPVDAVIREGDLARVWVVDHQHVAHCRPVQLGLVNDGYAQILGGLAVGEQVVVKGGLFVDKAGLN